MTYSEKLRDPRWQKKRLEILERDNFTCQMCKSTEKTLHVHHVRYHKKKLPWNYANEELVTLCMDDHEAVANLKERMGAVLHLAAVNTILEEVCNEYERSMREGEYSVLLDAVNCLLQEPSLSVSVAYLSNAISDERIKGYEHGKIEIASKK